MSPPPQIHAIQQHFWCLCRAVTENGWRIGQLHPYCWTQNIFTVFNALSFNFTLVFQQLQNGVQVILFMQPQLQCMFCQCAVYYNTENFKHINMATGGFGQNRRGEVEWGGKEKNSVRKQVPNSMLLAVRK